MIQVADGTRRLSATASVAGVRASNFLGVARSIDKDAWPVGRMVLQGRINPSRMETLGPFQDFTGMTCGFNTLSSEIVAAAVFLSTRVAHVRKTCPPAVREELASLLFIARGNRDFLQGGPIFVSFRLFGDLPKQLAPAVARSAAVFPGQAAQRVQHSVALRIIAPLGRGVGQLRRCGGAGANHEIVTLVVRPGGSIESG